MFRNRLYYRIKPLLSPSIRMSVRRWFALRKRERVRDVWPILPGSEKPPQGWPGWPEGKQFAVVLTHDVEGQSGLAKCRQLMELEMKLGFRSSFNFIPEARYSVPPELRHELTRNGFEVGVHDLHHDGRLYHSRQEFAEKAVRINRYLKEWDAVGFRSGSMLHNLEWLHDLDVAYDASTFDTDPFEPQPDGVGTIFPFWVPNPRSPRVTRHASLGDGYVELPYTLPQDSTLFLLFGARSPALWLKKLDWVAEHGGMVLLDTHPDYSSMNGTPPNGSEYSVKFYEELLRHIRSRYAGTYWHALPREVANLVQKSKTGANGSVSRPRPHLVSRKPKIWIDLDNTPHVPFFEPILEELKARGFPLLVTARDAFQVCDLADAKGLSYLKVGRHHGKYRLLKAAGLAYRSLQLAPIVLREKPVLAVSHGARSQLLLSTWLRIHSVLIEDYEYSRFPLMMRPTSVFAPEVIPDELLSGTNIHKYPGIKEDVYAWKLKPDAGVLNALGIVASDLLVTVRPPATEAHYHNPESEKLFERFMEGACRRPQVKIVLLPRNKKQSELIRRKWPNWFANGKTVIPGAALEGLNLIWHSDLVVSGGGTMNREAAALGVPVYSVFRGVIGAVDQRLSAEGRLILIESVEDVERKIRLEKRPRRSVAEVTSKVTLHKIVDTIEEIAETCSRFSRSAARP